MGKKCYKKIWARVQLRGASIEIFLESEGLRKGQVNMYQGEPGNEMILIK